MTSVIAHLVWRTRLDTVVRFSERHIFTRLLPSTSRDVASTSRDVASTSRDFDSAGDEEEGEGDDGGSGGGGSGGGDKAQHAKASKEDAAELVKRKTDILQRAKLSEVAGVLG